MTCSSAATDAECVIVERDLADYAARMRLAPVDRWNTRGTSRSQTGRLRITRGGIVKLSEIGAAINHVCLMRHA